MKDPAFLFYPSDYIGGTMGMTFEEKGAYMDLLMLQFNRGHMTTHMIGQTVGQLWVKIEDKFCQDKDGLWYNERLELEQTKRKQFTESRRNNIKGKNQHTKGKKKRGHMTTHMEDRDINKDISINKDAIEIQFPFDSENFKKWWSIWKDYKKEQHNFKYKGVVSEQSALKKLNELANGQESEAIAIIEQSISQSWKGFFEIKNNHNGQQTTDAEDWRLAQEIG